MKKFTLRFAILFSTFFLGLGSFLFVLFYLTFIPEVPQPKKLFVQANDCVESKSYPGLSKKNSEIKKGKTNYFPKVIFGNDMSPNHSVAGWYSKHLKVMDEKSLLDISDEDIEVYRFLWLRTFHHPIFVRIERESSYSFKLVFRELSGAGGYEPGKILRTERYTLTEEQWCEFIKLLEDADYWQMDTTTGDLGYDGSQWILEGVKENRYHVVDRWTPKSGEYREACIYLLKLSGIDVDRLKDDLY